ncbi:MAG: CDP-glycerol glycerophosphotransferase family protein [bacterium]
MARALIHIHRASNLGAALPFAHAMRHGGPWDLALSVTSHDPDNHVGLPESALSRLRKLGIPILDDPREASAQITFTFDPVESTLENCGLLVRVPAGVRGSGKRFTNLPAGNVDNLADLVLLPGPWHADRLRTGGGLFAPTEVVGLPSLDPLTANWLPSRELFCQQLQIDPSRNIILYAPTHELELSAVPRLWTRIGSLADERNLLILRLHPESSSDMVQAHKALAQQNPNVILAREVDVQPYLRLANLVITDVSTIAFEGAALGIPVVLFDNPNQSEFPGYDRVDPEYSFRSFFPQARDLDSLKQEVQRVLEEPEAMAKAIHEVRSRLIRVDEGTAVNRVIEATVRLLKNRTAAGDAAPKATALIPVDAGDEALVMPTVESLFARGGIPLRALLAVRDVDLPQLDEIQNRWPKRISILPARELTQIENELAGSPFTVLIHPGVQGENRWLLRLVNHLRRYSELSGIVPLMPGAAPAQDPRILFHLNLPQGKSIRDLDRTLAVEQAGIALRAVTTPRLDVAVLRTGSDIWHNTLHNLSLGRVEGPHTGIGIAADVVMTHPGWTRPPVWERMVPLTHREIAETERRIRELAEWVGRIAPVTGRKPENGTARTNVPRKKTLPSASEKEDGRLRLALHYENRGDREMAIRHLKPFLADKPDHPTALEAAKRLGFIPEPVN